MGDREQLMGQIVDARSRLGAWRLQRRLDRLSFVLAANVLCEAPSSEGEPTR